MTRQKLEPRLFWQRSPLMRGRYEWYFLLVNSNANINFMRIHIQRDLSPFNVVEIAGDHIDETKFNYEFCCMYSLHPEIDWKHVYRSQGNNLIECRRLRILALKKLEWRQDIGGKLADIYYGG